MVGQYNPNITTSGPYFQPATVYSLDTVIQTTSLDVVKVHSSRNQEEPRSHFKLDVLI